MASLISKINTAVKKATSSVPVKSQTASAYKAPVKAPVKATASYKPTPTVTKYSSTGAPMSSPKLVSGVLKVPNMTYASSIQKSTPYQGSFAQQVGKDTPSGGGGSPSRISSASLSTGGQLNPDISGDFSQSSSSFNTTPNFSPRQTTTPTTNVIGGNTLVGNQNPLVVPEQKITDFSEFIPTPIDIQGEKAQKTTEKTLEDYLSELTKAPDIADSYRKAQQETDILNKQKIVGDLTGQLNAIVNKGQANQLSLIGQGRGIPEAIIGGQQAQIGRETAIAALPVQAQLSAAQGNLEMANDNLDKLFKIYSEDAKNEHESRVAVKKMVYEYATTKEKRVLEKLDKQEERAYQEKLNLQKEAQDYAKMAFANNQGSLGAKIASLNYKSPTFRQDLSNLTSRIYDPIKSLQEKKLRADILNSNAGEVVKINGADYIRYKDGTISNPVLPESKDVNMVKTRLEEKILNIDKLTKNNGGVGLATSAGSFRGAPIPFVAKNAINDWRAGVINITQKLTVDELGRVKSDGVTFGALSNGERLAVGQAATKLNSAMIFSGKGDDRIPTGKFKMSERAVLNELKTIQDAYKLDFLKRTGVNYDEYKKNPNILSPEGLYVNSITSDVNALQPNPYIQAGYTL